MVEHRPKSLDRDIRHVIAGQEQNMTNSFRTIIIGAGEFLLLALFAVIPPLFLVIDVVVLESGVTETSVTEVSQSALLLIAASAYWWMAYRCLQSRGFFMLVAGFFSCMLIRELDVFLDHIWHGFWIWPALLVALGTIGFVAFCCKNRVVKPMASFVDTKPCLYIEFGLVVVLVFSRIFGSGKLVWKLVLREGYLNMAKSAIQEGIELFGYLFIAYGAFLLLRKTLRVSD
jgi:hypothetical protein